MFRLIRDVHEFFWILLEVIQFVWTVGMAVNVFVFRGADATQVFNLVKDCFIGRVGSPVNWCSRIPRLSALGSGHLHSPAAGLD